MSPRRRNPLPNVPDMLKSMQKTQDAMVFEDIRDTPITENVSLEQSVATLPAFLWQPSVRGTSQATSALQHALQGSSPKNEQADTFFDFSQKSRCVNQDNLRTRSSRRVALVDERVKTEHCVPVDCLCESACACMCGGTLVARWER